MMVQRGEKRFVGFRKKARRIVREFLRLVYYSLIEQKKLRPFRFEKIVILANPYVDHIAVSIQSALVKYVETKISHVYESVNADILYIVLCPQFYGFLPRKRIVINFEQPASLQYFTHANRNLFKQSIGVFDYTYGALQSHWHDVHKNSFKLGAAANTHGISAKYQGDRRKEYDFVFYGDVNARREKIIRMLEIHFTILIITGATGVTLETELIKAKACLNIHSYPDSPFETVRFFQCLNLHLPTISEVSKDQSDYADYEAALKFIDFNMSDQMCNLITDHLSNFESFDIDFSSMCKNSFDKFACNLFVGLNKMGVDLLTRTCNPIY